MTPSGESCSQTYRSTYQPDQMEKIQQQNKNFRQMPCGPNFEYTKQDPPGSPPDRYFANFESLKVTATLDINEEEGFRRENMVFEVECSAKLIDYISSHIGKEYVPDFCNELGQAMTLEGNRTAPLTALLSGWFSTARVMKYPTTSEALSAARAIHGQKKDSSKH